MGLKVWLWVYKAILPLFIVSLDDGDFKADCARLFESLMQILIFEKAKNRSYPLKPFLFNELGLKNIFISKAAPEKKYQSTNFFLVFFMLDYTSYQSSSIGRFKRNMH